MDELPWPLLGLDDGSNNGAEQLYRALAAVSIPSTSSAATIACTWTAHIPLDT